MLALAILIPCPELWALDRAQEQYGLLQRRLGATELANRFRAFQDHFASTASKPKQALELVNGNASTSPPTVPSSPASEAEVRDLLSRWTPLARGSESDLCGRFISSLVSEAPSIPTAFQVRYLEPLFLPSSSRDREMSWAALVPVASLVAAHHRLAVQETKGPELADERPGRTEYEVVTDVPLHTRQWKIIHD